MEGVLFLPTAPEIEDPEETPNSMEQNAVAAGSEEMRKRKHQQLDDDFSRRTSAMSPKDNGGKSRKTKIHDIELEQIDANVSGSMSSANSAGSSRDTSSGSRKKGKRKI